MLKESKERKVRQKWSDISVYEQKKSLNFLGKQLRKDPYNNQLKQKYFYQLKCFRKIVKTKQNMLINNIYLINSQTVWKKTQQNFGRF